jgi:hypothetical protein
MELEMTQDFTDEGMRTSIKARNGTELASYTFPAKPGPPVKFDTSKKAPPGITRRTYRADVDKKGHVSGVTLIERAPLKHPIDDPDADSSLQELMHLSRLKGVEEMERDLGLAQDEAPEKREEYGVADLEEVDKRLSARLAALDEKREARGATRQLTLDERLEALLGPEADRLSEMPPDETVDDAQPSIEDDVRAEILDLFAQEAQERKDAYDQAFEEDLKQTHDDSIRDALTAQYNEEVARAEALRAEVLTDDPVEVFGDDALPDDALSELQALTQAHAAHMNALQEQMGSQHELITTLQASMADVHERTRDRYMSEKIASGIKSGVKKAVTAVAVANIKRSAVEHGVPAFTKVFFTTYVTSLGDYKTAVMYASYEAGVQTLVGMKSMFNSKSRFAYALLDPVFELTDKGVSLGVKGVSGVIGTGVGMVSAGLTEGVGGIARTAAHSAMGIVKASGLAVVDVVTTGLGTTLGAVAAVAAPKKKKKKEEKKEETQLFHDTIGGRSKSRRRG